MSDFITNAELRIEAERLCDENDQLKAENARLKQELEAVGTAAYLYGRTDLADENAKLKEERDHWRVEQVHAYGNWEDAHKRATELEAENAKLRELLHDFLDEHADYIAEGNYFIGDLDLEHAMHHNQAYFRHEAKKLGIEVPE